MKHQNSNITILTALLRADLTALLRAKKMLFKNSFAYDKQGNVVGLHIFGGLTDFQRKAFNRINQTLANKAQSEIKAEGFAIVKQLGYDNCPTELDWQSLDIVPPSSPGGCWTLVYIGEYVFDGTESPNKI